MKDTTSLVMPSGPPQDTAQNDTEADVHATEGEGSVEEQAQRYYDEIMEVDPRVCKALYELLKAKYEVEDKTTAKEKTKEKKATDTKNEPAEFNTEGSDY